MSKIAWERWVERKLGVERRTYKGLGYQQAVDVTGEGPVTEVGSTRTWVKVLDPPSTKKQWCHEPNRPPGVEEDRANFWILASIQNVIHQPTGSSQVKQVTDGTLIPEKSSQRIPVRRYSETRPDSKVRINSTFALVIPSTGCTQPNPMKTMQKWLLGNAQLYIIRVYNKSI